MILLIIFLIISYYINILSLNYIFLLFIILNILSFIIVYNKIISDSQKEIITSEKINSNGIVDVEYYHDCFKNYSPAVLSFILKDKITRDGIDATIINLINEKLITINENGIETLQKDYEFSQSEKYIIDNYTTIIKYYFQLKIKDTFISNTLKKYRQVVIKEMLDLNLVTITDNTSELNIKSRFVLKLFKINYILCITLLFLIILIIIFQPHSTFLFKSLGLQTFFTMFLYLFYFTSSVFVNDNKKSKYIRTKDGMQLYKNLVALRKYLIDFTNIPNESINKIKLWDNYIVCSIVLNIKGNLDKEISNKIENYFKIYKNYKNLYLSVKYMSFCKLCIYSFLFSIIIIIVFYGVLKINNDSIIYLIPSILNYGGIVGAIFFFFLSIKYEMKK
jgi:uncharacterized membrane protein